MIEAMLLMNMTMVLINTTLLLVMTYKIGKVAFKNATQRH